MAPGARRRGSRGISGWGMACHVAFSLERRAEAAEGRCDGSGQEPSSTRHRSHGAAETQGGKRQLERERKKMERGREGRRGGFTHSPGASSWGP